MNADRYFQELHDMPEYEAAKLGGQITTAIEQARGQQIISYRELARDAEVSDSAITTLTSIPTRLDLVILVKVLRALDLNITIEIKPK
jgi:hypothetical protein